MTERIQRIRTVVSMPSRPVDAHKGQFGRVLIVGGSRGMIGAVALATEAALRGGAGLVTFAAPRSIQQAVAVLCPCAMSVPLDSDDVAAVTAPAVGQVLAAAERCDVVAAGPGMGVGTVQQNIVQALLGQDKPVVLDADGLNNLARVPDWSATRRCPLVLTPHPGEMARLTAADVAEIQADRESAAVAAARQWGDPFTEGPPPLVVVLKGAGTVVTDGGRLYVNATGNPGMATGGSGDVLTGLTAALIGQAIGAFDAASLAVGIHGRAGDLAAERLGQASLTAADILDELPAAVCEHAL